ncbi:MAG: response regulator [Desulfobacteraceae bacterium]|nr:response regulator [Desulfobacteraceae bacterium]
MPKTILFVDEEEFIQKALARRFRKMRNEWDIKFASSPIEAARALANESVDVIITETVFSEHSGLDLLKAVQQKLPQIVRIILSGYSDRDVILKSVDLAHQYLAKPCDDNALQETIIRAFMMQELLNQKALKNAISQIDSLPSLPSLYMELVEELKSENASIQTAGDIIAKDLGLTTTVLKLVNSSFFGLPRHISNPAHAASLLGLDLIKAIVMTSGTFDKFKKLRFPGFSLEQLWAHAMATASFAKCIGNQCGLDKKQNDMAFMAGLLHDIGKLLIAAHLPGEFKQILKILKNNQTCASEAEFETIGTSHAAIGAYLLGLWGLPKPIVEAAAYHHDLNAAKESNELNAIVHVANAFANAGTRLCESQIQISGLDDQFLQKNGLLEQIAPWRSACVEYIE